MLNPIGMRPMKNHNQPDLPFLLAMTATITPDQKLKLNRVIGGGGVGEIRTAVVMPIYASPIINKKGKYSVENHPGLFSEIMDDKSVLIFLLSSGFGLSFIEATVGIFS
jgi:hypothetical protein